MTLAKCALIVIAGLIFYFGIEFYTKMEVDSIAERTVVTQKRLIALQQEAFRSESDMIAALIFDGDLKKEMFEAFRDDARRGTIRQQLLERYRPVYEKLSKLGLRHLQLHLPDGSSFLRVHNARYSGDSLLFRPSIASVIREHKPVYGFEIGRYGGAYRAVYPLFHEGVYVGSAELSFSFNILKKAIEEVSRGACRLVLAFDGDLLKKSLDRKMLEGYRPCAVDPAFMVKKEMYHVTRILQEKRYRADLIPYREFFTILEEERASEPVFYVASFIPLKLISGREGGYYIVIHRDKGAIAQVMAVANIAYFALGLLVLVSLVLTIMVHIYRLKAHAANIDALTGIYNRRGCLKQLKNGDRRYALLYIDIDHFKQINDKYGHERGDLVLKEVVHIISAHIRKDDVFCRHGGEEFLLFVANAAEPQAAAIAEKLRKHIQIHRFEEVGNITVSVGIAIRERNESIGSLIARADKNLYKAKNDGRNRVVSEAKKDEE
ncbi:diguanylate cyclase [Hydrogenimonas sp.]